MKEKRACWDRLAAKCVKTWKETTDPTRPSAQELDQNEIMSQQKLITEAKQTIEQHRVQITRLRELHQSNPTPTSRYNQFPNNSPQHANNNETNQNLANTNVSQRILMNNYVNNNINHNNSQHSAKVDEQNEATQRERTPSTSEQPIHETTIPTHFLPGINNQSPYTNQQQAQHTQQPQHISQSSVPNYNKPSQNLNQHYVQEVERVSQNITSLRMGSNLGMYCQQQQPSSQQHQSNKEIPNAQYWPHKQETARMNTITAGNGTIWNQQEKQMLQPPIPPTRPTHREDTQQSLQSTHYDDYQVSIENPRRNEQQSRPLAEEHHEQQIQHTRNQDQKEANNTMNLKKRKFKDIDTYSAHPMKNSTFGGSLCSGYRRQKKIDSNY